MAHALRHGDLAYLMDHRSPDTPGGARSVLFDGHDVFPRNLYRVLLEAATEAAVVGTKHVIRHEQLFGVFELLVGDMPKSKGKLTKRLGHQHLTIGSHTQGSTLMRGVGVTWKVTPEQAAAWRQELADEAAATALVEDRSPRPCPEDLTPTDVPV